jgi:4-hydroxy-2-oxoglutarate aldolase
MNNSSVSGIIPAVPTPFRANGDLDLEALRFNLDRLNKMPLSGYVIGGSNGEFVYLNEDERTEVVKAARAEIPGDRLLIVGTGMESTRATIEMEDDLGGTKTPLFNRG